MATYYVKNGGNDAADGLSDGNAWETIAKVEATVTSGDTVYFRSQDTWTGSPPVLTATEGVTYNGKNYGSGTRATIKLSSGGVGAPIGVAINVSNVSMVGFNFDGGNYICDLVQIGYGAIADISNILIEDCLIHDNYDPEDDYWSYGLGVFSTYNGEAFVRTVSDITIKDCEVYDTGHEGIALYQAKDYPYNRTYNVLVQNCIVHDTGKTGDPGFVGVELANHTDNVTIEYCELYNNDYGVMLRNSSDGSPQASPNDIIVRYNIIRDSTIAGIVLLNSKSQVMSGDFHHNLFYNNGKTWASAFAWDILIDGSSLEVASIFDIYNNTFHSTANPYSSYDAGSICLCMYWDSASAVNATVNFKNNIVYCDSYTAIYDKYAALTHSNNLVYRTSGANDEHVWSDSNSYNRAGVATWEPSAVNSDPLFVNATTDFHLQTGSPCRDAGTDVSLTEDYDGNAIKIGSNPDIGAYEYWGQFCGTQSIASIMGVSIGNISQVSGLSKAAV